MAENNYKWKCRRYCIFNAKCKIFIKGDVGYRVGIHMKAYENLYPVIIIGGTAQDFLENIWLVVY